MLQSCGMGQGVDKGVVLQVLAECELFAKRDVGAAVMGAALLCGGACGVQVQRRGCDQARSPFVAVMPRGGTHG